MLDMNHINLLARKWFNSMKTHRLSYNIGIQDYSS